MPEVSSEDKICGAVCSALFNHFYSRDHEDNIQLCCYQNMNSTHCSLNTNFSEISYILRKTVKRGDSTAACTSDSIRWSYSVGRCLANQLILKFCGIAAGAHYVWNKYAVMLLVRWFTNSYSEITCTLQVSSQHAVTLPYLSSGSHNTRIAFEAERIARLQVSSSHPIPVAFV